MTVAVEQMLATWDGQPSDPAVATFVDLLVLNARRWPRRAALTHAGGSMTYRELDERTNQFARFLCRLGVGSSDAVAVCANPSVDLITSIIAVMKTGATYAPVFADHSGSWLRTVFDDLEPRVVLAGSTAASEIKSVAACTVVHIDDPLHQERVDDESSAELRIGPQPENLAYIIYTSGSTGAPKGVAVTHANLASFLGAASMEFPSSGGHGSLLFSSMAFDLPVPNVFLPLAQGEDVVILEGDTAEVMDGLAHALTAGAQFSTVKLTPSHLELLLHDLGRLDGAPKVTNLVVAGEPFPGRLANAARDRFGLETNIINEYGPTEATVGSTCYLVPPDRQPPDEILPIGRPLANTEVFVLDGVGGLVPVGVV
ncbi:MAG: AMP-binding protein, partial [Pseudonocardiaceae bacterium]